MCDSYSSFTTKIVRIRALVLHSLLDQTDGDELGSSCSSNVRFALLEASVIIVDIVGSALANVVVLIQDVLVVVV